MSKELLYQIIDNKIDKIVYKQYNNTLTNNDCKTLISTLKLYKSNNLTLDLSTINLIENDYDNLYKLLNYLKNDNKIVKLNLSYCNINNFNVSLENIIYESFKNNSTIHSLNVSNNSLILTNIILTSLINNKNNNLKSLGISINNNYNKDTFKLLLILLEKNIITSLKLLLSSSIFEYYTEFKSLLKSIENNTSLQKIKIILNGDLNTSHDKDDIILLLLINSIIKNKNIKVLKIKKDIVRIETFNYLILNNKYLETIKFTSWAQQKRNFLTNKK